MVTLHASGDKSCQIVRNGEHIGYLMWLNIPRIVLNKAFEELSITEIESVLNTYKEIQEIK